MIDALFEKFQQRLAWVDTGFVRSLMEEINWDARLMQGLSFREYLNLTTNSAFPVFSLDQTLREHLDLSRQINKVVKPILQKDGNSWIAADDIEYGQGNKVPLWLFGFLY